MNVFVEENSLKDIGNAIREKNGEAKQYLPREMGNAVRGLGGEEEWKKYATSLVSVFEKTDFKGIKILNLGKFENVKTLQSFFQRTKNVEEIIVDLNENNEISFHSAFQLSKNIKKINLLGKVFRASTLRNTFYMSDIEEVLCIFDCTNVKNGSYDYFTLNACKLKRIRFLKNTIKYTINFKDNPLLSLESTQSIIDGLATVTEPQTVSFHPDVKAKLTQEQITQITSKNWNLA